MRTKRALRRPLVDSGELERVLEEQACLSSSVMAAYCTRPQEESSARAALYLRKHGVADAHALTGGVRQWQQEGRAIVKGRNPQ